MTLCTDCGCKSSAECYRGVPTNPATVSPIQPAAGGMTDEEIMDAAREHCQDFRWPSSAIAIARAIEAKAATRQTGGVDQACQHRIADARNPVVRDGYVCVDCGALFRAADHGESGLVGVTMELEDAIPEGWALSIADFSMRAGEGPTSRRTGWVSLSRTGLNRKAWLELREAEREATPLYVNGVGPTLRAAILDAVATLCAVPGEPT